MDSNKNIFFIYICLTLITITNAEDYIQCANSGESIPHLAEDGAPEIISTESFQICRNPNDYCYTVWQEDPNNGTVEIKSQGKFNPKKLHLYTNIHVSY